MTETTNGTANGTSDVEMVEEAPVVRMRNGTTTTVSDGMQATLNGQAAIQRGRELLAEQEADQNLEEIKKLDSQLDHFNQYLDKFEKKNEELTARLTNVLKNQREERIKRRASFIQREEENKNAQTDFESQIRTMLSRCAQTRRTSMPAGDSEVSNLLEQSRRLREGVAAASIAENEPTDVAQ